MNFIIGGQGVMGQALVRYHDRQGLDYEVFQRQNMMQAANRECDILFYANGNGSRFLGNRYPYWAYQASVDSTAFYAMNCSFRKMVFFSTGAVYTHAGREQTVESAPCDPLTLDSYGFEKRLCELIVMKHCVDWLIFRISCLVGPGLSRGHIYDYLAPEKQVSIAPSSVLNIIHTDRAVEAVFAVLDRGESTNTIYNLGAKDSLCLDALPDLLGRTSAYKPTAEEHLVHAELNVDRLDAISPLPTSSQCVLQYAREAEQQG